MVQLLEGNLRDKFKGCEGLDSLVVGHGLDHANRHQEE